MDRPCPTVCDVDDPRCRPEVLLQFDDDPVAALGDGLAEFGHQVDTTPAPAEDRLTVVSDGGERSRLADDEVEEVVLDGVEILHLVHNDMRVPLTQEGAGVGVALQKLDELGL